MTTERRRQLRRDALKTGTLVFAEGHPSQDCLVWNVNTLGALLEVEGGAAIAATGRLVSEALFVDRPFTTIWRDGRKIGVAFQE
ncbi:pilus assembly protein PilZ [Methylobacterium aerolatum]|uniref:Pilus assembly protein PilZ n=1 Tax=Methylobacterium aerolatum TaxID=418708 RepID=A0ABU0HWY7_9HYPH|nr:pilus assembly protein PilZ [Methylobacterium aerolatum]MDQ0446857.1 hypothetical protein [Methylobacterium aerolatum]GJD33822.1 hypothetical protein FMGBMHLM_0717 [Methylobacterium aerolatum]